MLTNVIGAKCVGIEAVKVTVEVEIMPGTGIHLVGLADTAVKESLLRTITALQSLEFRIPGKKIVINLAPADVHKSGSGYDLPIAMGIIASSSQADLPLLGRYLIMGELGLNGTVRDIPESLVFADLALKLGLDGCILPLRSALEASAFRELNIYGVQSVADVVRILSGAESEDLLVWNSDEYIRLNGGRRRNGDDGSAYMDFAEIIGQDGAKRGVEIAAAGGHNLMLMGPPGAGKSSLVKAMAGILPPMTREEAMLTSKIYSAAGKEILKYGLICERPVRAPHYSASLPAIIGGGNGDSAVPGEVSLAQNGILFLDEFNMMPKSVIEALRGPLEDRKVVISRLKAKVEYPASFILAAAANPCPCGYYGEGDRCTCTPTQRMNYFSRLSGPILDRIDLQIFMHSIDVKNVMQKQRGETSAKVLERVEAARKMQLERFEGEDITTNAEMNNKMIDRYCPLSGECRTVMGKIMERMELSMRAYYRIVKVARTIADLENAVEIESRHLVEAASYRFLDKKLR